MNVPTQSGGQKSGQPARPWKTEGLPKNSDGDKEPSNWWRLARIVLIGYAIVFLALSFFPFQGTPQTIPYPEFTQQVSDGNVKKVFTRGDSIQGELIKPVDVPKADPTEANGALSLWGTKQTTYTQFETERPSFAQDDLLALLKNKGVEVRSTPIIQQRSLLTNILLSFGPILLLVGLYFWMLRRSTRMMGGMFGGKDKKKPVDPETVRVTFEDVAGIDEVEDEISEIVDYLKNPSKYEQLGARAPKGVLLSGAPGTGKTLLARATAGEAGVPYFSSSGSEFIEMIVGVGAQRVRELFNEARKVAPSIIFIDEIDTIGRRRGGSRSIGGHDEREQTLNQVLTEMDGFEDSSGVVVIAATNRPDVLDPALLRPGRFDRTITVHAPDKDGRRQILDVHTRKVPLETSVDLDAIAASTPGMTGAELSNLVNEAALIAAKQNAKQVSQRNLMDALEKVQLGAARKVIMPEDERQRTAWHEAGHALLGMLQPGADPVRKVSIIPRGRALGVTFSAPEGDRYGYDRDYLLGRIVGALGGMAAEHIIFNVVTTGAASDLKTATGIARSMVGRWGMSEAVGPVQVLDDELDPRTMGISEQQLNLVDDEVRTIIEECYARAISLLTEHRDKLQGIVDELLVHETLDEPDIYKAAGIDLEAHKAANRGETTMVGAAKPEESEQTTQEAGEAVAQKPEGAQEHPAPRMPLPDIQDDSSGPYSHGDR
ncbi:ATP-dependent zinc metalloprotease FtsH [Stomatohabitans albus]|uniref:ATP-dependent zinc metalloprotease FtsH n=1 Tax=Stomatohabitans albus TaxID=3110766 RepID=UPI00300C9A6C